VTTSEDEDLSLGFLRYDKFRSCQVAEHQEDDESDDDTEVPPLVRGVVLVRLIYESVAAHYGGGRSRANSGADLTTEIAIAWAAWHKCRTLVGLPRELINH